MSPGRPSGSGNVRRRRRRASRRVKSRLQNISLGSFGWPLLVLFAVATAFLFVPKLVLLATDEGQLYSDAEQQLHNGQTDAALATATRILEKQPASGKAYLLLARIELDRRNGDAAIDALDNAVVKGVPGEYIHAHLGAALMQTGDYAGASEALQARIIEQDLGLANRLLARLAARAGNLTEARELLDLSRSYDDEDPALWADYALYFDEAGETGLARQALSRARRLAPDNLDILAVAGRLAGQWSGPDAALAYYDRALERAPDDLPLLADKASALGQAGRYQEMLKVAYRMLDISPRDAGAHYLLAWLAVRAEKPELASRMLERAEGMMGDSPAYLLLSGVNDYRRGNYYAAIDRFRLLSRRQPQNARAAKLLALSLMQDGKADAAWRVIAPFAQRPDADNYMRRLAMRIRRNVETD